nr:UPF0592 membrane protein C7D4.03c-like [Quercus suber]POE50761.1 upf0592 membrane protein [Quercus suber]
MPTVKGIFNETDLLPPADHVIDITPPDSSGCSTPDDEHSELQLKVSKQQQVPDLAAELQKSPKIISRPNTTVTEDDGSSEQCSVRRGSVASTSKESMNTVSTVPTTPILIARQRSSVNSSISRAFNRKSWYSTSPSTTSRSPSPPKAETVSRLDLENPEVKSQDPAVIHPEKARRRKSFLRRRNSSKVISDKKGEQNSSLANGDERPVSRRSMSLKNTLFRNASRESLHARDITHLQMIPPVPAMPKSFSTDRLPTFRLNLPLPDRAAPMPKIFSNERVTASGLANPKKKDELWSVFRALDGDYTKFSSKSTAFKANVVRTTLIPFLRNYATHPSNKLMRPEDLDRRTNILNKWWTGLIEMLHGRNNQSISGTDRPVILDGISGIMERPEWRKSPQFTPLAERAQGQSTAFNNRSTTSLASTTSEFLTDSVYHNVRNIFIQNLSAQMAFVVDKMSLRNASASLVSFCGKACAFAFIFVPGMADVLVRLWDLQMDTIRKVLDEAGIGKFDNLASTSSKITQVYPPALHQLGFVSLMKLMRKLRTPPPLPLGTANIQWWGHWLDRWTGRESDLFYVFVKHYHILAVDFLNPEATKMDRMCAPGMVLVHAQILTNLDATIHRDAASVQQDSAIIGATSTFDNILTDPDAVAAALPIAPMNAVRIMAENRLIMLLRDFLSDQSGDHPIAQQLFAESFNGLLHASARGTSVYDHAACYTLLDFLEEALLILVRFEHVKESEGLIINSAFWQSVCKRMISSHNSMTEIRLYAFLYTVWNSVVCDLGRKANLCLGLLLDPEIFESRFNHWCPMVRAYYMRLLCWRVGRFDGEASAGDLLIYETMLDRLKSTWSYYVWLCEDAASKDSPPPATNPCHPAPGRRLLIMRTDLQAAAGGSFLSFNAIVPKPATGQPVPVSRRMSTLSHILPMDIRPGSALSSETSETSELKDKGIGVFFRKMMGVSKTRGRSESTVAPPSKTPTEGSEGPEPRLVRSATDDGQILQSREASSNGTPKSPTTPTASCVPSFRTYTFKFSLDYHNNKHMPGQMRLLPPRLPLPAQLFLQEHSSRSTADVSPHAFSPVEPQGASVAHARYCGRALAEWMMVVGECQSFFERRKKEGVPNNKSVETPTMGVEVFRRPS